MTIDTPITDKAWQETTKHGVQHLRIAAKELERENIRLRAQLALATDAIKREVGIRAATEARMLELENLRNYEPQMTHENGTSGGVGSTGGSASLAHELSHPESMLRRTLTLQVVRLRALAATMEEEGKCLKILGTTEKRIPHAFSRGAEMCNAADMARDWADHLEALLPND